MKKVLSIVGGVVGFLGGVLIYMLVMEIVFESDRLSTKLGAVFAIGGAMIGSWLVDFVTGWNKESPTGVVPEDHARQEKLWRAVLRNDPEEIEGLRDVIRPQDVAVLASRWKPQLAWKTREALIFLLTDQTAERNPELKPLLEDGLSAPTYEARPTAYCSLTGDFDSFTKLYEGGESALAEKLRELRAKGITD